jgi:putative membrane protein
MEATLSSLFAADSLWGVAAGLWIVTGLTRAFGHVERDPEFYLRNGFFYVKMALFVSVVALEIVPMVTFIRWRIARRKGGTPWVGAPIERLVRINDIEVGAVVVIVFVAALMARGAWLF